MRGGDGKPEARKSEPAKPVVAVRPDAPAPHLAEKAVAVLPEAVPAVAPAANVPKAEVASAPAPAPKDEAKPVAADSKLDNKADLGEVSFDQLRADGLAATKAERWGRAIGPLSKALKMKPDAVAARELGKAFYMTDKAEKARDELAQSIQLDDKDAETFMYYGMVLADLDRKEDAKKAYRRFLALEPADSQRAQEISAVLQNLGR
jgi:Flp pilus assembly protein TadD